MIATTSYRRNGLVIADAIEDSWTALRLHRERSWRPAPGDPRGRVGGGEIVTMMAERDEGPYQGAVVFDATLYAKEPNTGRGSPSFPILLLFVATYHEFKQANGYVTALVTRPAPAVQPALFTISREGHTNINQPEHLAARRALIAWVERGRDALPSPADNRRYFDATVPVNPGPSLATMHPDNHGFDTWVAEVDAVYGNVLLQAQDADFDAAGIQLATTTFGNGGPTDVLYGRTFTDVRNGGRGCSDADGHTVLPDERRRRGGQGSGSATRRRFPRWRRRPLSHAERRLGTKTTSSQASAAPTPALHPQTRGSRWAGATPSGAPQGGTCPARACRLDVVRRDDHRESGASPVRRACSARRPSCHRCDGDGVVPALPSGRTRSPARSARASAASSMKSASFSQVHLLGSSFRPWWSPRGLPPCARGRRPVVEALVQRRPSGRRPGSPPPRRSSEAASCRRGFRRGRRCSRC